MGDDVQAIKAGIMEIADIFVINKADQPGADQTQREIEAMLSLDRGAVTRRSRDMCAPSRPTARASRNCWSRSRSASASCAIDAIAAAAWRSTISASRCSSLDEALPFYESHLGLPVLIA